MGINMMNLKTAGLVLAVAGVLMCGGWAAAQGPEGPGMGPAIGPGFAQHRPPIEQAFGLAGGQFWNNPNFAKQLNLTDDQRKAMDGILQDHRMKLIDLRATLEKAELSLTPLITADTPNKAAIESQIDKVVAARGALEKANAQFLLDLRLQLKPEQWKQLQTMREARMAHGREMGPGARGMRGPEMRGPGARFHGPNGPMNGVGPQEPPADPSQTPQAEPPQGAPAAAPGAQPQGPGEEQ